VISLDDEAKVSLRVGS